MDSGKSEEVVFDFSPVLRTYKDGRVERLLPSDKVPPSVDPVTGVSSQDVVIIPETGVSARLYLPKVTDQHRGKLPILVYFHGGAFCIGSALSRTYNQFLNTIVGEANVIAVSVEYRLAPEHPLPIAYNDSWDVLKWVASHATGEGHAVWLKDYADFGRVYMAGDSAGANIAHNMAMLARDKSHLPGLTLTGIVLFHPFFAGVEPVGSELNNLESKAKVESSWAFLCPSSPGCDDRLINPLVDPNCSALGCDRVLVCVAEKDQFRDRGQLYYEMLAKNGWKGKAEFVETKGEDHVFFLFKPTTENAANLIKQFGSFINQDDKAAS